MENLPLVGSQPRPVHIRASPAPHRLGPPQRVRRQRHPQQCQRAGAGGHGHREGGEARMIC